MTSRRCKVNEHVVKPMTLAAGGMSYALMKHPQGLDCQVFISHSWREGIFHLDNSVRRAWPQFPGLAKSVLLFVGEPTESGHQRPAWRMGVDMAKTLLRDLRRLGLRQVEVWCERIAV